MGTPHVRQPRLDRRVRRAAPTARLAAFYDLPPAYLNKQLQALVRAGILSSTPGPRGGFRLARRLEDITVLDVVVAIEGMTPAFACTQILHQGPGADPRTDYREACVISQTMARAELAWRQTLASETLADVREPGPGPLATGARRHPRVVPERASLDVDAAGTCVTSPRQHRTHPNSG